MIRKMTSDDIETVGQIWLTASIKAHDFVPAEFWRSDLKTMTTEILPHPDTEGYVHEEQGVVDGFISLGGNCVGCLFIIPDRQRNGIGSALLNHVKQLHSDLVLSVYKKNVAATQFYLTQGFETIGESTCKHTGCEELRMRWGIRPEQDAEGDAG